MPSDFTIPLKFLDKNHPLLRQLTLLVCVCIGLVTIGESKNLFTLSENLLSSIESEYGDQAKRRLLAWQTLIRDDSSTSDMEKLEEVNSFFNQLRFISDLSHWGKSDYWATPVEFLSTDGGDCEDFALAKYFTLKALGVDENKLNMTYVKALELNQAHMVITYYETPGGVPLVLDSLVNTIQPATERQDLLPVYSFNGTGLWLAKSRGKGEKVGSSDRLKRWRDLLSRMPEGLN